MRYARRNGDHITFPELWALILQLNPPEVQEVLAEVLAESPREVEAMVMQLREPLEPHLIRKGLWRPSTAPTPAPAAPAESEDKQNWLALAAIARQVLPGVVDAEYAEAVAREFEAEAAAA